MVGIYSLWELEREREGCRQKRVKIEKSELCKQEMHDVIAKVILNRQMGQTEKGHKMDTKESNLRQLQRHLQEMTFMDLK